MKIHLSLRKHCYLAALSLAVAERTLLTGIAWHGALYNLAGLADRLCAMLVMGLLAVSFGADVKKGWRKRHIIVLLILSLLAVSAWITKETMLLSSAAFILLARNIPYEKITKAFFHTAWVSLLLLMTAYVLGFTESYDVEFGYAVGRSLGMAHPNNLAAASGTAVLLWGYRQRKQPILYTVLGMFASALLIYGVTASRTMLVLQVTCCAALPLYALLKRTHVQRIVRVIRFGFVLLFACSVWMMLNNGDLVGTGLGDENFLSRFVSASALFRQYGVKPFGAYIEFRSLRSALLTGQPAVILDPAYLFLIISQGIVPTGIFFFFFARATRRQIESGQAELLILTGLFLIAGLMERYMLDSTVDFALLSAFALLETNNNGHTGHARYGHTIAQVRNKLF